MVLVIVSILLVPLMSHSVLGWFNNSWDYRKAIVVNEHSGYDLYDYPIHINVTWEDGMQKDFGDLRFIWINTSATPRVEKELNYFSSKYGHLWFTSNRKLYIDTVDGKFTDVIVKVPYIPANKNTTIYMYYGNDNVAEPSYTRNKIVSFYNTFDNGNVGLGRDASCNSYEYYIVNHTVYGNNNKWGYALDIVSGDIGTCNDCCLYNGMGNLKRNNGVLIGYDWATANSGYCQQSHWVYATSSSSGYPCSEYRWFVSGYDSTQYKTFISEPYKVPVQYAYSGDIYYPLETWYYTIGTWYNYTNGRVITRIEDNDTIMKNVSFYRSDGLYNDGSKEFGTVEMVAYATRGNDYIDNMFARTYTDPEPTFSIGVKQSRIYTSPLQLNWLSSLKYYFSDITKYFLSSIITIVMAFGLGYATKSSIVGVITALISIIMFTIIGWFPVWAGILVAIALGFMALGGRRE